MSTSPSSLVIGLSGKKRSGKNTVADFICQALNPQYKATQIAFADALKSEVATACEVTTDIIESKKDVFRPMLQWWGTEFRRGLFDDNYWIDRLDRAVNRESSEVRKIIIVTDVRFPNEFNYVQGKGGLCLRIIRDTGSTALSDKHSSETALDDYDIDFEIHNDASLENLKTRVTNFTNWAILPRLQKLADLP